MSTRVRLNGPPRDNGSAFVRLAVIVGSTRPGRVGPAVASWLVDRAGSRPGVEIDLVDLAELGLPFLDETEPAASGVYRRPHTRQWSARVAAADAVVLVTPEYNGAFPAPLKNALDYLYQEWRHKPVGLVGYGFGAGGAGAVTMLEQVVQALRMDLAPAPVTVDLGTHLVDGGLQPDGDLEAAADDLLAHLADPDRARVAGAGKR